MPPKKNPLGNTLDKKFKRPINSIPGQNFEDVTVNKFGAPITKPVESSVTEQNDVAEFLSRAELLGAKFSSEGCPSSLQLVGDTGEGGGGGGGILSKAVRSQLEATMQQERQQLTIPRRPPWSRDMSATELDDAERQEFGRWRQSLASLEAGGCVLTPYERNLEFWRQLWRVIERSHAVVQIADARDPLFYYSGDLCKCVQEDYNKLHAVVLNKCDLLQRHQLLAWRQYFTQAGIHCFMFSSAEQVDEQLADLVLTPEQLADALTELAHSAMQQQQQQQATVGLVGYPNVGKSSTINALLQCKKVPVSACPGRTKHLQTVPLSDQLLLCDCPGLVMPQSVCAKADLIVNGVLPIDNMRNCLPPVELLCQRVPVRVLREKYSVRLPDEATATDFLAAFARLHGFMTSAGQPHNDRAARIVLKEFVAGANGFVYCHPPPGFDADEFNTQLHSHDQGEGEGVEEVQKRQQQGGEMSEFDEQFFTEKIVGIGFRSKNPMEGQQQLQQQQAKRGGPVSDKPWKQHHNKNKREKLRKTYKHLDA